MALKVSGSQRPLALAKARAIESRHRLVVVDGERSPTLRAPNNATRHRLVVIGCETASLDVALDLEAARHGLVVVTRE